MHDKALEQAVIQWHLKYWHRRRIDPDNPLRRVDTFSVATEYSPLIERFSKQIKLATLKQLLRQKIQYKYELLTRSGQR